MKTNELISMLEMYDSELDIVLVCGGKDYPTGSSDRVMEGEDNTVLIFAE